MIWGYPPIFGSLFQGCIPNPDSSLDQCRTAFVWPWQVDGKAFDERRKSIGFRYPLVDIDPENHQALVETKSVQSLLGRVYVNLLEGMQ